MKSTRNLPTLATALLLGSFSVTVVATNAETIGKKIDASAQAIGEKAQKIGETVTDKTKQAAHAISDKASDTMISSKIKLKFATDKILNPFKIDVDSSQGVVTLTGKVDTDVQYERAVAIAQSINGVNNVHTEGLEVKQSEQPVKDTFITGTIYGKLLKDHVFKDNDYTAWGLTIETKDGKVTIVGEVDNEQQKQDIVSTAQSVSGVASVDASGVTVKE